MLKIALSLVLFVLLSSCGKKNSPAVEASSPPPIAPVQTNPTPPPVLTWASGGYTLCTASEEVVGNLALFSAVLVDPGQDIVGSLDFFTRPNGTDSFPEPNGCSRRSSKNSNGVESVGSACDFETNYASASSWQFKFSFPPKVMGTFQMIHDVQYVAFSTFAPQIQVFSGGQPIGISGGITNMCRRKVNGNWVPEILVEYKQDGTGALNYFMIEQQ
jgi:hypothetical protein